MLNEPEYIEKLQQVKTYYESDDVIRNFLSPQFFDKLVWHTQFEFIDDNGILLNETDYLLRLASVKRGDNVLDFGCGMGNLCFIIASNMRCGVHGVNISEKQIEYAWCESKKRALENKVTFTLCNGGDLPYENSFFDVILFQESICHVLDKEILFLELFRILKPRGCIAGQDWFVCGNGDDSDLIHQINSKYYTHLKRLDDYSNFARNAGFQATDTVDVACFRNSTHFLKFGGVIEDAIKKSEFTIGFFYAVKADNAVVSF